ncbi:MAG: hypothetical protein GX564_07145 [Oligosphaeraceae bacterium]|nr:hypothetical protein [Oligosphaeraceae bacterium]
MMAKPPRENKPLSFVEIVMRADAETIRTALEARIKVDELLAEREQAYRRIAELEAQVEELVGEPGVFVFPLPPLPVAGFSKAIPVSPARKPDAPAAAATPAPAKSSAKNAASHNTTGE